MKVCQSLPTFRNAPSGLRNLPGDALKEAGFNVMGHAAKHKLGTPPLLPPVTFGSNRALSNTVLTIADLLLGLQNCSQRAADLKSFLPSFKLRSVSCSAPQRHIAFTSVKSGFEPFARHGEERFVFQRS